MATTNFTPHINGDPLDAPTLNGPLEELSDAIDGIGSGGTTKELLAYPLHSYVVFAPTTATGLSLGEISTATFAGGFENTQLQYLLGGTITANHKYTILKMNEPNYLYNNRTDDVSTDLIFTSGSVYHRMGSLFSGMTLDGRNNDGSATPYFTKYPVDGEQTTTNISNTFSIYGDRLTVSHFSFDFDLATVLTSISHRFLRAGTGARIEFLDCTFKDSMNLTNNQPNSTTQTIMQIDDATVSFENCSIDFGHLGDIVLTNGSKLITNNTYMGCSVNVAKNTLGSSNGVWHDSRTKTAPFNPDL